MVETAVNSLKSSESIIPEEIERKFLVKKIPLNLEESPHKEILQGYLSIGENGDEVRLRKSGKEYFITSKQGKGLKRKQPETTLNAKQFSALWPGTEGQRIRKTRYLIDGLELDIYHDQLKGLATVEREFDSEEESTKFRPLPWLGEEVTYDERYKNKNLVRFGIPEGYKPLETPKVIPTFPLKEGVEELVARINQRLETQERVSVLVAGGSASGKTSEVAAKPAQHLEVDVTQIAGDDWYKGKEAMEKMAKKGAMVNWDHPMAVKMRPMADFMFCMNWGITRRKPVYDFVLSEPIGTETITPGRVIILDSIFALHPELKSLADIKVFVDIGLHGRILRRLLRDVDRTGQRPEDILKYFSEVVQPMHEEHILSTRENADFIIVNEYQPHIEAVRSGLHEYQVKFQADIDPEVIRRMGGERLALVLQEDTYYNPLDRDLSLTGEMLRIRAEGQSRILTYKGPREKSVIRKRPKFEFGVDQDTAEKFLRLYGESTKVIWKERTLYTLKNIVFSQDTVAKVEDGRRVDLGTFLEIRAANENQGRTRVPQLASRLGLNFKDRILESYAEM